MKESEDVTPRRRIVVFTLIFGTLVSAHFWLGRLEPPSAKQVEPAAPRESEPYAPNPWSISTEHDELDGAVTIIAVNALDGDRAIVVRATAKNLVCYIATGSLLETVENMHSRRSIVKYRFDDQPIVSQEWTLSDDNTALVVPGNPRALLKSMSVAKKFLIQYSPADITDRSATFDVTQFPPEILSAIK